MGRKVVGFQNILVCYYRRDMVFTVIRYSVDYEILTSLLATSLALKSLAIGQTKRR